MAIAAVQETGAFIDASTDGTRAFTSNVAANSLVVVIACKENTADDLFVAGDFTKSAGTATIDTPTLDATVQIDKGDGQRLIVGIASCLVTGAGSLTMGVAGGAASQYWGSLSVGEYSGSWDGTRVEASSTNSTATDNQSPAVSGNATSAGAALFIGGLQTSASGAITITPDAAFTQIAESEDGSVHAVGATARRIVASGTTDQAEWSITGANFGWSAAVVVYKEAGAAADPEGKLVGGKLTGGGLLIEGVLV